MHLAKQLPGNQIHVLGVASTMSYSLSYRNAQDLLLKKLLVKKKETKSARRQSLKYQ